MSNLKLTGLAAAFRQAVEREEEERKRQEDSDRSEANASVNAEAERKAAAQSARMELLKELVEFGKALGDAKVKQDKGALKITRGDASVTFLPEGDEDRLGVQASDIMGSYIQRDVAGDWLLCLNLDGNEQYRQLVTDGIEEIMVYALGYPRPEEQSPNAEAQALSKGSKPAAQRELRADPEARATVDPRRPSPGSTVKDLTDPFA